MSNYQAAHYGLFTDGFHFTTEEQHYLCVHPDPEVAKAFRTLLFAHTTAYETPNTYYLAPGLYTQLCKELGFDMVRGFYTYAVDQNPIPWELDFFTDEEVKMLIDGWCKLPEDSQIDVNQEFMVVVHEEYEFYDEDRGGGGMGDTFTPTLTSVKSMLEHLWCTMSPKYKPSDLAELRLDYIDSFTSSHVIGVSIYTVEDYEKRERAHEIEEMRRRCEGLTSEFCTRHQLRPGTFEFFQKIEEEIEREAEAQERWNNPEIRMEEWAAHRFAGGGSESYYSDLNYVNSRHQEDRASLDDILEFAQFATPLIWMQYEEQKMANQALEDAA